MSGCRSFKPEVKFQSVAFPDIAGIERIDAGFVVGDVGCNKEIMVIGSEFDRC